VTNFPIRPVRTFFPTKLIFNPFQLQLRAGLSAKSVRASGVDKTNDVGFLQRALLFP
jgi:hypothetical protein